MKTKSLIIGLFALATVFTSCEKDDQYVTPSGSVTTVTKIMGDYTQLDVADAFDVFVTFSDFDENVRIEANSNLQPYINIENHNDQLMISLDDHVTIRKGEAVLNIYITTKRIDEFSAAGAVSIQLENELQTNTIDISLSGASHFSGTLYANKVNSSLIGASGMDILGETDSFEIDVEGASNMTGFGFVTNQLEAELDGASNMSLTIQETLDVHARGASIVRYKGNGTIKNQDLTGSSQIIKVN